MKLHDVKIGQRFRKRDKIPSMWEVIAIGQARDPIPHVRLARIGDPFDTKVVSLVTLADSNYYRLETETPGGLQGGGED